MVLRPVAVLARARVQARAPSPWKWSRLLLGASILERVRAAEPVETTLMHELRDLTQVLASLQAHTCTFIHGPQWETMDM